MTDKLNDMATNVYTMTISLISHGENNFHVVKKHAAKWWMLRNNKIQKHTNLRIVHAFLIFIIRTRKNGNKFDMICEYVSGGGAVDIE